MQLSLWFSKCIRLLFKYAKCKWILCSGSGAVCLQFWLDKRMLRWPLTLISCYVFLGFNIALEVLWVFWFTEYIGKWVLLYLSVSNGLFFLFFPSAVGPEIVTWVISLGQAFALSFSDVGWAGTLGNELLALFCSFFLVIPTETEQFREPWQVYIKPEPFWTWEGNFLSNEDLNSRRTWALSGLLCHPGAELGTSLPPQAAAAEPAGVYSSCRGICKVMFVINNLKCDSGSCHESVLHNHGTICPGELTEILAKC